LKSFVQTKIELTPEAVATLRAVERLPETALIEIAKAMKLQTALTISHIQSDYLSFPKGQPPVDIGLRVQSGRLRQSLHAFAPEVSGQNVSNSIGDNVVYARIHEFGGRTSAHDIRPKTAKALRFPLGGRMAFAKVVHHPGSDIPARAPIQHGIEDRLDDYAKAVSDAITNAFKQDK
jgi:phage gpG-like protein